MMLVGLLLFTLDEVHLFRDRPHVIDTAHGYVTHASVRSFGAVADVYVSTADLALRWGLVFLVVAAALWALALTLKPVQEPEEA